ncbi:uncharacterized protein LOC128505132 [Spea bombifrons]|uniref:uncharacterized protein LOC128505132 n=1 Tax=Spea bombifrons TaxID=233779 RepID=UPI00234BF4F6|nr:uncharacterized protein LOC128505132 [Spea bombifrons]
MKEYLPCGPRGSSCRNTRWMRKRKQGTNGSALTSGDHKKARDIAARMEKTGKPNRFWKKGKTAPNSHPEAVCLLSNNRKKTTKNSKIVKRLGEEIKMCVESALKIPRKYSKKRSSSPSSGRETPKDEAFSELVEKKRYLHACDLISQLETDDVETVGDMYQVLAGDMWRTVQTALTGDNGHAEELKPVADCLKWARKQRWAEGSEWSPRSWDKDLENLLKEHIRQQLPAFVCDAKTKPSIRSHLEDLERTTLQIIERDRPRLGDLFMDFAKCLAVSVLHHLSSLATGDYSYEECVLLYRWGCEEHRRQRRYLAESEDFDHLLFVGWFGDSRNKVTCTGKKTIGNVLREILQKEIVWNTQPDDEPGFYFHDILKEASKLTKAVEDLGETLVSDVQGVLRAEFLHFVTRYNVFLEEKIEGNVSGNQISTSLRVLKNCQILRTMLDNLGKLPEDKSHEMTEIPVIINKCERRGVRLLCAALRSAMKKPFQTYFQENDNQYKNILQDFKKRWERTGFQYNKQLVEAVHQAVVGLYIQTFIGCSKRICENKGEMFTNGGKFLQNAFQNLCNGDLLLDDPMDYISQILNSQDAESLQTTVFFFCNNHPDLREEHLKAIMKIKGNLNPKEKEQFLYYLKERKNDLQEERVSFFEDIEVKPSKCCCVC